MHGARVHSMQTSFNIAQSLSQLCVWTGSVAMVNSHSKGLLLASSTFTRSQALFGGAIYGDVGTSITIRNSRLTDNCAVSDGGAVFCDNCQHMTLEMQTELSYNAAAGSGGAVYCDGCILMTAKQTSLSHNRSGSGLIWQ